MATLTKKLFIPEGIIPPHASVDRFSMVLYGGPKVGKSKLCTKIPDHFILCCAPGNLSHLAGRYVYIDSFERAIDYLNAIEDGQISCNAVVIDELDVLYQFCRFHYRAKLNIDEYSDKDTYGLYRCTLDHFNKLLIQLGKLNKTVIVTFNEEIEDHPTLIGEQKRFNIRATKQLKEILEGKFLLWTRMYVDREGARHLQVEGSPIVNAGNGYENHFLYEGRRLKSFSLGKDAEYCWDIFKAAFENQWKGEVI